MLAEEILSNKLFPLKPTDSVKMALELMHEMNVAYLPVVEGVNLVGYISLSELMDVKSKTTKIGALLPVGLPPSIPGNQHLFEVIRVFANIPSTTLAVVNSEGEFTGIISAKELVRQMASFSGFLEAGSVISLEMGVRDYSLSEIARIVEYNNAKVLGVHLQASEKDRQILVHLKLNTSDLKSLVATFERYNYRVIASYYNEDDQGALRDRYNLLMRFLDF